MGEVTGPVIATTLVLLAVFVPVSFMPGITGELYRQFSVTICVAVVLSSLNALTVAPALCRLLLAPDRCAPGGLPVASRGWSSARERYVQGAGLPVRRGLLTVVVISRGLLDGRSHRRPGARRRGITP